MLGARGGLITVSVASEYLLLDVVVARGRIEKLIPYARHVGLMHVPAAGENTVFLLRYNGGNGRPSAALRQQCSALGWQRAQFCVAGVRAISLFLSHAAVPTQCAAGNSVGGL